VRLTRYPDRIQEVVIDGHGLELEDVVAVARYRARVRLDGGARERVALARAVVDRLIEDKAKVYGLTTGFGSKRDILVGAGELELLQANPAGTRGCAPRSSRP
jgi:histidine ammonia-lyase